MCAILDEAVKIVNLIKSRALNTHLFSILCNEMLLHAEVRWLSRGKVLTRLYYLCGKVLLFLTKINAPLAKHLADANWLAMLDYLFDIFDRINSLNTSLQVKEFHVCSAHNQVSGFWKNLHICTCGVLVLNKVWWKCFQPWRMLRRRQGCLLTLSNRSSLRIWMGFVTSLASILDAMGNQCVRNLFSFPARPRNGLSLQGGQAQLEYRLEAQTMKVLIPFTSTYLWVWVYRTDPNTDQGCRWRTTCIYFSLQCSPAPNTCASKARPHWSHWYGQLNWKSKLCCLECINWLGHRVDAARSANDVNSAFCLLFKSEVLCDWNRKKKSDENMCV